MGSGGARGHGDTGTRGEAALNGVSIGKPERMLGSVMDRAVIAMTADRSCACVVPGKVTDLLGMRPPTDVMAITSLPHAPANPPVRGFPLLLCVPNRQPLTAKTYLGISIT
jgi:hypothetical protein